MGSRKGGAAGLDYRTIRWRKEKYNKEKKKREARVLREEEAGLGR